MKTLVDLKNALSPGTVLILISSETSPGHPFMNVPRKVAYRSSNGVGLTWEDEAAEKKRTGFLDYPRRRELVFYEDDPLKFTCNFEDGPTNLTYRIVPKALPK